VEKESNKRIEKYRKYASEMKLKFTEYELQSEKYYSEMLNNFKKHAKEQMQKK
jgi:hypothetical protein